MDRAKRAFSKAANAILSRLQGRASEEVIFYLLRTKALPILLYAAEAVNLSTAIIRSLDFCVVRFAMKTIRSSNPEIAATCIDSFGLQLPSVLMIERRKNFLTRFNAGLNENIVCMTAACMRH